MFAAIISLTATFQIAIPVTVPATSPRRDWPTIGEHHGGELKRETAKAKGERIVQQELKRLLLAGNQCVQFQPTPEFAAFFRSRPSTFTRNMAMKMPNATGPRLRLPKEVSGEISIQKEIIPPATASFASGSHSARNIPLRRNHSRNKKPPKVVWLDPGLTGPLIIDGFGQQNGRKNADQRMDHQPAGGPYPVYPSQRPIVFLVGSNKVFSINPSSATIYAAARMKTVSQPFFQRIRNSRIKFVPTPYKRRLAKRTKGFKYGDEPLTYSAVSGAKKNKNQAGDTLLILPT